MREVMLIVHFIGLGLGLGTGFGFMFLGIAASKMEGDEGNKFMLKASALGKMGHIGLGLLLVSGAYLIWPYAGNLMNMPLLLVKLVLFLILGATIGMASSAMRKAAQGNTVAQLKRAETFGKVNLVLALAIVVLTVYVFH